MKIRLTVPATLVDNTEIHDALEQSGGSPLAQRTLGGLISLITRAVVPERQAAFLAAYPDTLVDSPRQCGDIRLDVDLPDRVLDPAGEYSDMAFEGTEWLWCGDDPENGIIVPVFECLCDILAKRIPADQQQAVLQDLQEQYQ